MFLKLLKSRQFLPLFITQFFGAFNDNAFKNALLIWFTYDIAIKQGIDSKMMLSVAAGIFILPFFLFSASAGKLADKFEKSKLVRKVKWAELCLMSLGIVFFYIESLSGLLLILFLMGLQSTVFGPIKYSLLPEHLAPDQLVFGNGLIEAGTFLSILLGTMFGGLIISFESGLVYFSVMILLFTMLGLLSSYFIPTSPVRTPNLKLRLCFLIDIKEILAYVTAKPKIWLAVLMVSWFWFIGATFLTQIPAFVKSNMHSNEGVVTLFLTTFCVGIGIGSVACNKILKGKINFKLVIVGAVGMSFAMLLFTLASVCYKVDYSAELLGVHDFLSAGFWSYVILLALLFLSISAGLYIVPLNALIQSLADKDYLARIIAANNILNALFMVVSSLVCFVLFSMGINFLQLVVMLSITNSIVIFFNVRANKKLTFMREDK